MSAGRFSFGKKKGGKDEYNDPPRPFLEHLFELRTCIIQCAISWLACIVIMIPLANPTFKWLQAPAGAYGGLITTGEVTGGIFLIIKIALWGGTALSLPLLLFFIMRFVFPGLKRSERSAITICLALSTVFFVGGVWAAYAKVLGTAIKILMRVNIWMGLKSDFLLVDKFIAFSVKTIIAFGVAFQLPLVLLALGWIGLISSATLRKQRRVAIVTIFVLAMFLTPPDPFSQTIMAIPMYILFEACIWIIRLRELARGKPKEPQTTEIVKP
jgi:sec-independent protein translocase protein TatC